MSRPTRRVALVLACAGLLSAGIGMVLLVDSDYKITQMRNAFIASRGENAEFRWAPDEIPDEFLAESTRAPEEFDRAVVVVESSLPETATEFERALALARHLESGPSGGGGGIKSNTREAYRVILSEPRGYCSDYTQVLNGLAYAANIPIREWGMSFDNYSGDGHGFSEVYDDSLGDWVLVDAFYSLYVVDAASGRPLSALEFRERLAAGEGSDTIEVRAIEPQRFGFTNAEKALEYYRRGSDGFFLYFGNNVFSYDANPAVSALGPFSRALEEGVGIMLGIRPTIRLLTTETNGNSINALLWRRNLFLTLAALAAFCGVVLGVGLLGGGRRRRAPN